MSSIIFCLLIPPSSKKILYRRYGTNRKNKDILPLEQVKIPKKKSAFASKDSSKFKLYEFITIKASFFQNTRQKVTILLWFWQILAGPSGAQACPGCLGMPRSASYLLNRHPFWNAQQKVTDHSFALVELAAFGSLSSSLSALPYSAFYNLVQPFAKKKFFPTLLLALEGKLLLLNVLLVPAMGR